MIFWLKDKHLNISLDGEVVNSLYGMMMTVVVTDGHLYCGKMKKLKIRISIEGEESSLKTSTESWSVRGMIWTVYKHWSAPSFEKMFLTMIDSEKSRTMSPSPGDRCGHLRTS